MKKYTTILVTCLITMIIGTIFMPTSLGEDIGINSHNIDISKKDNKISIEELINISGISNESNLLYFSIQQNSQDITLTINNNQFTNFVIEGNEIICNLSSISDNLKTYNQIIINYNLDKDVKEFQKTIKYQTDDISVLYDKTKIFTENNIQPDNTFTLKLYEPSETPLSLYMILFIVLLVILLIVSTLYSLRKQKAVKIKDMVNESEELLQAKKTLLMTSLKDIEKQHRAKKISDDTYHKLKNYYKQQAVEAMKKLDEFESKLK